MIYEFWGVLPPEEFRGQVEKIMSTRIKLSDLTADPHDQNNWSLIALRFPELADVIPPPQFAVKSNSGDPGESVSQLARDLDQVRHLGTSASLADISEVLNGSRYYSGKMHKRLKRLREFLKTSSSSPSEAGKQGRKLDKAA